MLKNVYDFKKRATTAQTSHYFPLMIPQNAWRKLFTSVFSLRLIIEGKKSYSFNVCQGKEELEDKNYMNGT